MTIEERITAFERQARTARLRTFVITGLMLIVLAVATWFGVQLIGKSETKWVEWKDKAKDYEATIIQEFPVAQVSSVVSQIDDTAVAAVLADKINMDLEEDNDSLRGQIEALQSGRIAKLLEELTATKLEVDNLQKENSSLKARLRILDKEQSLRDEILRVNPNMFKDIGSSGADNR